MDICDAATGASVDWAFRYGGGYGDVIEQQSDFESRPARVLSVAFSPSGRRLAVGSEVGLYVHDLDARRTAEPPSAVGHAVDFVAFSGEKLLWSAASGSRSGLGIARPRDCAALALAADGRTLVAGFEDGTVHFLDVTRRRRSSR